MTSPTARAGRPLRIALAAIALLVTALVFWPILRGAFVYDDLLTVGRNPAVTSFEHLPTMFTTSMWDFLTPRTSALIGYWRPLGSVALALGFQLGDGQPLGFHALSLVLHLAATALAFRLALRLTHEPWIAFFAALVFGLHPVHVESVAWISSINDPLFGLFALASIDAWFAWRERGVRRYPIASGVWFVLALLSKEPAVCVIPIVVALDLVLARTRPAERMLRDGWWRAYVPLALAFVVWWAARAFVFGDLRAGFDRTTTHYGVDGARLARLRIELLGDFIGLAVWPAELRLFHPFVPRVSIASAAFLVPLALIVGWTWLIVVAWKRRERVVLACALFVPASIVPLLVSVQSLGIFPLSERYLYLAVFGVAVLVPFLCWRLLPRALACAVLALVVGACAWKARERIPMWRDELTLFTRAAEESPRTPYAHWQLGRVLLERHRIGGSPDDLRDALASFERSSDLVLAALQGDATIFAVSDDALQSNLGLGWSLLYEAQLDDLRDFETPITLFKTVTTRYPTSEEAWTGLGVAEAAGSDLDAAATALEQAIALNERYVEAQRNLGEVRLRQGRVDEARRHFENALRWRPDHLEYLLMLVATDERSGDLASANELLERAIEAHPNAAAPLVMRANLAAQRGDFAAALATYDQALARDANHVEALTQKGKVLLARGDRAQAAIALRRACELAPRHFEAHYSLAALLLQSEGWMAAMPYLTRAYEHRPSDANGEALRTTLESLPLTSAETCVQLATTDADRGDFTNAMRWTERALSITPAHGPALYLKGSFLRREDRRDEALVALRRACEVMPQSLGAHDATASLLVELGREREALPYLERAVQLAQSAPGDADARRAAVESLRTRLEQVKARAEAK